jgi:hypothetical protein
VIVAAVKASASRPCNVVVVVFDRVVPPEFFSSVVIPVTEEVEYGL